MIVIAPVLLHPLTAGLLGASATAYSPCSSGSVMADGTRTRWGSAASNTLPMHSRIRLVGSSVLGRRTFTIRDRGGKQMQLDFWMPSCSAAIRYGRHFVHFRLVRRSR